MVGRVSVRPVSATTIPIPTSVMDEVKSNSPESLPGPPSNGPPPGV